MDRKHFADNWEIARRTFLKASTGLLSGLTLGAFPGCTSQNRKIIDSDNDNKQKPVRFGIVTDLHYSKAPTLGTRFYKQSVDKLSECIRELNGREVKFFIELGDFKDQDRQPDPEKTLNYLKSIEKTFQEFKGLNYHVLGNHDVDSLDKPTFLSAVTNSGIKRNRSYYSFDSSRLHCVVLDANFRSDEQEYASGNFKWTDANIPSKELIWLREDLSATEKPTIVFTHQLLDGTGDVYVENAVKVRDVLQKSNKVLAVLQGHHHDGAYSHIGGIHYYTLKAAVEGSGPENNSYAIVEVSPKYNITITGFRKAVTIKALSRLQ